jgi:hypothetical protein
MSIGKVLVFGIYFGGGNNGSTAIFNAFSTMLGIILAKSGELSYRHGLVFTYINHVAKS